MRRVRPPERRALTEAVHRAERTEAKGRLAGEVPHDSNHLLHMIGGEVEALRRILRDDPNSWDRAERGVE